MADQRDETLTPPAGHALPGGAPLAVDNVTDDPEAVRAEIEQTRARMSDTIDEIEEALARKREQIQERLDVFSRVRERPLVFAGAAFGVGLLLGLLTGGGDDEEELHGGVGGAEWRDRSDLWERRARRLLRVAREQEEKVRELQERYGTLYAHELEEHGEAWDDADEALGSSVTGLRDTVLHGITGVLSNAYGQMGKSSRPLH